MQFSEKNSHNNRLAHPPQDLAPTLRNPGSVTKISKNPYHTVICDWAIATLYPLPFPSWLCYCYGYIFTNPKQKQKPFPANVSNVIVPPPCEVEFDRPGRSIHLWIQLNQKGMDQSWSGYRDTDIELFTIVRRLKRTGPHTE